MTAEDFGEGIEVSWAEAKVIVAEEPFRERELA